MHARHNAGTCSDPYIISDHDLSASEHITVFQIMVIRDNGHMRTDLYVVSDRDPFTVQSFYLWQVCTQACHFTFHNDCIH